MSLLPRRLLRTLAIVGANVTAVFLILSAAEWRLYLKDAELWKRYGKNGVFEDGRFTWGHRVVRNRFSVGYRERDFAVPKPPDVYRIMVLGDSFTWGAGLAPEDRYSNKLERLLAAAYPAQKFEVLNFGFEGGPTINEAFVLEKYYREVQPDRIVVGFCLNDPQPRAQAYSLERARMGEILEPARDWLKSAGFGRVAALLADAVYRLAENHGYVPRWEEALDRAYRKDSLEWRAFEEALCKIKALSDSQGLAPPILAVLNQTSSTTTPSDYGNPDPELKIFLRWYDQVIATGARLGFVAYDHRREISEKLAGKILAVNAVDGHPSAELNTVYAEKLFDAIARDLNLAPAGAALRPRENRRTPRPTPRCRGC